MLQNGNKFCINVGRWYVTVNCMHAFKGSGVSDGLLLQSDAQAHYFV